MSFRGMIYSSRTVLKRSRVPGRSRRVEKLRDALLSLPYSLLNFIHGLHQGPRAEIFTVMHLSVPINITLYMQTFTLKVLSSMKSPTSCYPLIRSLFYRHVPDQL